MKNIRISINYITVYRISVYLELILNLGFFNIKENYSFITITLSMIISVFIYALYLTQKDKTEIPTWFSLFILAIFLIYIFQFIRLYFSYARGINFKRALELNSEILLLLSTFPILEILKSKQSKKFFYTVYVIGMLNLIFRTIVWYFFNFHGKDIAPGLFVGGYTWARVFMGQLLTKIPGTFIDGYLLIYSLVLLFNIKNSIKVRVTALLGLIFVYAYQVVVLQSRGQMFNFAITLIMVLFIISVGSHYKVRNIIFLLFLLLILIYFNLDYILSFLNTFQPNTNTAYGVSSTARLNGLNYFFTYFKENILVGMGILPDQIYNNTDATIYLSDYGLILNLFQFGIIGFVVMIIPYIKSFYLIFKRTASTNINIKIFLGLSVYMLINSFTTNPYWFENITILPIYFALILYSECY